MAKFFLLWMILLWAAQNNSFAQEPEIPVYETAIPNALKSAVPERRIYKEGKLTAISHVIVPRLLIFRPAEPNGTSIIICPGGGYRNLNIENVRFIAHRLNKMGITAFVLTYRLPADSLMADRTVGALQDVQQAFRLVRGMAAEWKLRPDRVGIWGSSAGGHLAAMAATRWDKAYETSRDTASLRPDFLILSWPVISFRKDVVHSGSMRNLLGENPSETQVREFSADENVTHRTPPAFLVHTGDDRTVSFQNSILFYQALKREKVPAELHIYETGGHCFGISPEIEKSWMTELETWLKSHGLINSKINNGKTD